MRSIPNNIAYRDGYNDAVKLFTSNKHINEIKAQAIEEAVSLIQICEYGYKALHCTCDSQELLDYANKLRDEK